MEIKENNLELKQISEKLKTTEKNAENTLLALKNNNERNYSAKNKNTKIHKRNKLSENSNTLKNMDNNNKELKTKNWLNSSLSDINNTIFSSLNTMENSNFNKEININLGKVIN